MEISSQHGDGLGESVQQLLADGSAQGLVEDATIASSLDQAKAFWHMRHVLPEVQKPEGGSIKADVSVPVASVPQFLEEASAAAKAIIPGCRPVPFGHLGDGNVHFNVSQPIGADTAQFLARWGEVNDAVNKIVLKYNGSISAEHGIGKLKRDSLPKVKDPVALELMLSACPEFRDDFLAWEPMSYREHFRLSQFKTRDLAVAAYDQADPNVRNTLDTLAVTMTIVLEATRAAMDDVDRRPETVAALAGNAIGWLKPLIARAGAIINGESVGENAPTPQDVVDRLMKR